jgi:hypothetical protein
VSLSLVDEHGLCIVWFRCAADTPTPTPAASDAGTAGPAARAAMRDGDPPAGYTVIPAAQNAGYTVTEADVGFRLGVIVRPSVGNASRWALVPIACTRPRTLLQVQESNRVVPLSLALSVNAHEHHKYCDRRVRVCTAIGRVREGNVIRAAPTVSTAAGSYRIEWYRSDLVTDRQLRAPYQRWAGPDAGECGPDSPLGLAALATEFPMPTAPGHRGCQCPHPVSGIDNPLLPGLQSLVYRRVDPRALTDLPVSPPDHAPAPPLPDIRKSIAVMRRPRRDLAAANEGGNGFLEYPLFADDIGRFMCAALVPTGVTPPNEISVNAMFAASAEGSEIHTVMLDPASGYTTPLSMVQAAADPANAVGTVVVCAPIGPVESAPPKAREVWIEGPVAVGSLLKGRVWYYGGRPGCHKVAWVAIDDSGETKEVRPPVALTPDQAESMSANVAQGTSPADVVDSTEGDSTPYCLRVDQSLVGCLLKFRVVPIRSDGEEGHQETSRPTAEVAAQ